MKDTLDLQTRFKKEILPALKKSLKIKNDNAVPKITKVVINSGIGSYTKSNKNKDFSVVVNNIAKIAGQKPVTTKSKKAISNFKVREGEVVGVTVTIRGKKMYHFLNKLINIVFPRVRDFRGLSPKSFDNTGNFSVGFKEHTVFPEISPDDVLNVHGIQLCINTTAKDDETGLELLKAMGFPFKSKN